MGQCISKKQGEAVVPTQEEALRKSGFGLERQKTIGTLVGTRWESSNTPTSWGSSHGDDEEDEEEDVVVEEEEDVSSSTEIDDDDKEIAVEFTVFNTEPTNNHTLRSVVADCDDQTFASTVAGSVATAKASNTRQQAQKRQNKNMDKLLRGAGKKKTTMSRANDLSSWGGLTSDDLISQVVPEDSEDDDEESDDGGMVWKVEDLNGLLRSLSNGGSLLGSEDQDDSEEEVEIMWCPPPVRSSRAAMQGCTRPSASNQKDCKYLPEVPIWGSEDL